MSWGDPTTKYGLVGSTAATSTPSELHTLTAPAAGAGDPDKFLGKANPMTAFVLIGAVALGFAAFSTTVRVGNSSASLNLGK